MPLPPENNEHPQPSQSQQHFVDRVISGLQGILEYNPNNGITLQSGERSCVIWTPPDFKKHHVYVYGHLSKTNTVYIWNDKEQFIQHLLNKDSDQTSLIEMAILIGKTGRYSWLWSVRQPNIKMHESHLKFFPPSQMVALGIEGSHRYFKFESIFNRVIKIVDRETLQPRGYRVDF